MKPTNKRPMSLRRADFIKWLKAKDPDTIVGSRLDAFKCPIARYIREHIGADVVVGPDSYNLLGTQKSYSHPKWVKRAIELFDYRPGVLTARDALELLGEAK